MAYIYKITNLINNKIYIGKTIFDINKRFKEHIRDSKRARCEKRPLYSAMNKYGAENFQISLVEQCDNSLAEEREAYWIKKFDSYHNGYNATLGGDGKAYLDYELIKETYLAGNNIQETAEKCSCCEDSVHTVLRSYNIPIKSGQEQMRERNRCPIKQISLSGEDLNTFDAIRDAARYLKDRGLANGALQGIHSHIRDAAKGRRRTAYKFRWEFIMKEENNGNQS